MRARTRRPHVPHRPVREIFELLDAADIPARVRHRSRAVFERLAAVEGAIHGVDPARGRTARGGLARCDRRRRRGVRGARIARHRRACAAARSPSAPARSAAPTASSPTPLRPPSPSCATPRRRASGLPTTLEVTTPTGAALMTTLASGFGAAPPMVDRRGRLRGGHRRCRGAGQRGAGRRRRALGEHDRPTDDAGTPVMLLEVNVDDATGEVLAFAVAALLSAGAHDAWITPIVMKKGRPAHTVSVLCDPTDAARLRALLVEHSGSLGVRATSMVRWPQRRDDVERRGRRPHDRRQDRRSPHQGRVRRRRSGRHGARSAGGRDHSPSRAAARSFDG